MSNLVIGQTGFIGNSIYSKLNNVVPFKPISWSTNDLAKEFGKLDKTKTYSLFWAAGNNNNNSTVSKIKEEIDFEEKMDENMTYNFTPMQKRFYHNSLKSLRGEK